MIRFYERDPYAPIQYTYEVENILYNGKSKFQEIMVIRNPHFGKMLILDGVVQITERDEFSIMKCSRMSCFMRILLPRG